MKSEHRQIIRRHIITLDVGQAVTIRIPGLTPPEIRDEAKIFCGARRIPCVVVIDGDAVQVTRTTGKPKTGTFPELSLLEIGQSRLIELPLPMHQKVRQAATHLAQSTGVRLTCNREGDFIRVTRLPATDAEARACGPVAVPQRATKYGLERLTTEQELRFNIPRQEQAQLRLAAHRQSIKTGLTIRCRLQDDGSMLVTRTETQKASPD